MIGLLAFGALAWGADEVVYGDELAPNWYDWSWSGIPDFDSNDAYEGKFAAFTSLKPNGGFSIYRNSGLGTASALRFWIKGSGSIALRFNAVNEGVQTGLIPLSPGISSEWTQHVISLDALPPNTWDRISFVDASGIGGAVHLDYIELLDDNPNVAFYNAAEPMPPNHVVIYGAGDSTQIDVRLNGEPLTVKSVETEGGPARTYVELEETLEPGTLQVFTNDGTFTRTLTGGAFEVGTESTHQISDNIYGANFNSWPPSPAEMDRYGYSVVRWGNHAQATYNPGTRTMNLGAEGYFTNQVAHPSLQAWYQNMDLELSTILTVPNMGWVADSSSFWQFSVANYGAQQQWAPTNNDAGNGVLMDGSYVANDPTDAAVRFNSADVRQWLTDLDAEPEFIAIGNELDTAHETHRGLHPDVADYDEQLQQFLLYARAAKEAMPRADVLGPVSTGWFHYWNTDDPAHKTEKGQDFLPWFLSEVAAADAASGERTLDYLDVHYYPEPLRENGWDNLQNTFVNAWRLRAPRSLWDPTFVDESWVGTDAPVTGQTNPDRVMLVPRLKQLIDELYPGTRLAISEWGFGADWGPSGGLAAADALGVFGREDVDLALISPPPQIGSYAGAAFELYRSGLTNFGEASLPVELTNVDPNLASVYAARQPSGAVTLVVINKSPLTDYLFDVSGLPEEASVRTKHFGGATEARMVESRSGEYRGVIPVPAYTAVLIEIEDVGDITEPTDDGPCCEDTDEPGTDGSTDASGGRSCGCSPVSSGTGLWWVFLPGVLLAARRRQS